MSSLGLSPSSESGTGQTAPHRHLRVCFFGVSVVIPSLMNETQDPRRNKYKQDLSLNL